jgi:hypothetical protein
LRLDEEGGVILEGLTEGYHYVHCAACGYPAEDLTPHIALAHPELVQTYEEVFPGEPLWSQHLEMLVQRSTLKGRALPAEVRAKMSANAGRWNKGLTKETDSRMATISEKRKGQPSWSKGLTKEDHPSLQSTSEKLSALKKGVPNDAVRLDLSTVDFTPYLDERGAVDRKSMAEALGVCEPTVTKYMESLGLRLSTKYVEARVERDAQSGRFFEMSHKSAEQTTIRLTPDQLEPYRLKNGKVMLGRAMVGLGHVYSVVKRECDRLGIPTHTWLVRQSLCLEAISKALGGELYAEEWTSRKFLNPATGHRFRYDGYFPSHSLVCEFHGYQHWVFPSVYIQKEELYFALQERDRIKENLIHSDPTLRYFLVREDEPYADPEYLRGRLIDEGVFDPGK